MMPGAARQAWLETACLERSARRERGRLCQRAGRRNRAARERNSRGPPGPAGHGRRPRPGPGGIREEARAGAERRSAEGRDGGWRTAKAGRRPGPEQLAAGSVTRRVSAFCATGAPVSPPVAACVASVLQGCHTSSNCASQPHDLLAARGGQARQCLSRGLACPCRRVPCEQPGRASAVRLRGSRPWVLLLERDQGLHETLSRTRTMLTA